MKNKKIFVLDTNVVLHDFNAIYRFEEHDVYLPVVVLEELDNFKKGNDQINFNARQFVRELDDLSCSNKDADFFDKGVPLNDVGGRLFVHISSSYPESLINAFGHSKKNDHTILASAMNLMTSNKDRTVVLVSKDINLRMKAKSLSIDADDYNTDKVVDQNILDKEAQVFENFDPEIIAKLYNSSDGISQEELSLSRELTANESIILTDGNSSVLAQHNPQDNKVHKVLKTRHFGIEPRNAEQTFAMNALTDPNIPLVAITGRAGTGKTLLALAAALSTHEQYGQILMARPIVALANKDLGFLPGDELQKITPYMLPLYDNLNFIKRQTGPRSKEAQLIDDMQKDERLVISPLAYIRGRSLSDVYFIIDEAQNLTPHEIKTIITRAGEGTKIVFTGDLQQIDSPYLDEKSNGLAYVSERMLGQALFTHINLIKGERSKLSEIASKLL